MNEYRTPKAQYIPIVYPYGPAKGRLAFKYDPIRGLIMLQMRGDRYMFDLTEVVKQLNNSVNANSQTIIIDADGV